MERIETDEYIEQLFDALNSYRQQLLIELRNDKDGTKEKLASAKMACIDGMSKNLLKFRTILHKAKK